MFLGLTIPHICSEVSFHGNNPTRTVWALQQRKTVMSFAHDHKFYQCRARTETCLFKLLDLANIYASSSLQAELKKDSDPQKAMHGVIIWPSNSTPRNMPKRNESISPHKNLVHTLTLTATVFTIATRRKQPKHLRANEWINNMLYLEWNQGLKKACSVLKSNEIVICAAIWTNLKNILLSERSQTKEDNIVWFHLYEVSIIGKIMDTENRVETTTGWEWWIWGVTV